MLIERRPSYSQLGNLEEQRLQVLAGGAPAKIPFNM